eukprot:1162019-Pelagomonas_calceolata.AAC.7
MHATTRMCAPVKCLRSAMHATTHMCAPAKCLRSAMHATTHMCAPVKCLEGVQVNETLAQLRAARCVKARPEPVVGLAGTWRPLPM